LGKICQGDHSKKSSSRNKITTPHQIRAQVESIPKKSDNNNERNIYSLFTALPKNLYYEGMKKVRCDNKLRIRHMSKQTEELRVGMERNKEDAD
jgi:hypothetical protein